MTDPRLLINWGCSGHQRLYIVPPCRNQSSQDTASRITVKPDAFGFDRRLEGVDGLVHDGYDFRREAMGGPVPAVAGPRATGADILAGAGQIYDVPCRILHCHLEADGVEGRGVLRWRSPVPPRESVTLNINMRYAPWRPPRPIGVEADQPEGFGGEKVFLPTVFASQIPCFVSRVVKQI